MIKELLEDLHDRGWNDTEIAAALGVSQPTVFRWRKGQRNSPIQKLVEAELRRLTKRVSRAE